MCWFIQTEGQRPQKSESAKECVTTHSPNEPALKTDGAETGCLYATIVEKGVCLDEQDIVGVVVQLTERSGVKCPLGHILVVIENIQMRTLKTEVGKDSTWTAIGSGLGNSKRQEKSFSKRAIFGETRLLKVNWVNIPNLGRVY